MHAMICNMCFGRGAVSDAAIMPYCAACVKAHLACQPPVPTPYTHAQVSFVNSICTSKGGTHVNLVVDQIAKCGHFHLHCIAWALRDVWSQ
jgi:DNA gyrase B